MLIFVLRLIIFSTLILTGFIISVHSTTGRRIITVIYILTVLWYCFLCRLPLFTTVPAAADSTADVVVKTEPSESHQIWKVVVTIFGSQPDGTLAGGGVFKAVVFNMLLFIPLGYLLLLWYPRLRQTRKGRIVAVLIILAVSMTIEGLQELTGLGMADWKDVLGNSLGGGVGVLMVYFSYRSCPDPAPQEKDEHRTVRIDDHRHCQEEHPYGFLPS